MADSARQTVDDPVGNRAAPRTGDKFGETERSPHDDLIKGDIHSCAAGSLEQGRKGDTRTDAGSCQIRK